MKKIIFPLLALVFAFAAHASEVTVLETELSSSRSYTTVDTKFHIDTDMREGFAKVVVQEEDFINHYPRRCYGGRGHYPYPGGYGPRGPWGPHYPGGYYCDNYPTRTFRTIFTDTVKIEGLTTNGNEVIYQGADGDVVCGKMGTSRVLKVPTFYLSGKCALEGKIYTQNGVKKLIVKFKTK